MSYDSLARLIPDMKQKRPIHLWLLALTFLVGQWLTVVHGTQHTLNAGEQVANCEICVAGHASAGPPTVAMPAALLPVGIEAPTAKPAPLLPPEPRYQPPPRGPPLLPA